MLSNHLILCYPLLLLPSIFPSSRVFPSEAGLCIRLPKDWSFSFSISSSDECITAVSLGTWSGGVCIFRENQCLFLGFSDCLDAKWACQVVLVVKNLPTKAGHIRDAGSVPGSGRSPGGGKDNAFQNVAVSHFFIVTYTAQIRWSL